VWNLMQALDREVYRGATGLRVGLNGPLAFDTSVKQIAQLANGHTLVVVPETVRLDPAKLLDCARAYRLDSLDCTPVQLEALLEHGLLDGGPVVARVLIGGETIPHETWRRLAACEEIAFYNVYGPTEATVDATCAHIRRELPEPTIGWPLPNVRTYVLDTDRRPVPVGAAGELFIGGKGVARGYRGDPRQTAERFPPDPFGSDPNARMYRTGDRVRQREDGSLEFLGRTDRQVKIRGFRIEPAEVESILEQLPGVRRAVVACSEGSRLTAYVVSRTGYVLDADELRRAVSDRLPPRMTPAHFVFLEALPLTRHGKIDYRALPSPNAAPRDNRPPTGTEQRLLPLWCESLSRQNIGIDDDFFGLGGHSLIALRLMARVEHEFGKRLPIATLFRHPTVRSLAAALAERSDANNLLVPIRVGNETPPLFLLPGAGGNVIYYRALASLLAPGRPVYGLQAAGLNGTNAPLGSIEEIAAANLREIRKVAPVGPYFLAGHSSGGKIAFEMSQQLRRDGGKVALLTIFDTPAPSAVRTNVRKDWDDAQWLAAIAHEIGVFLGRDLEVTREVLAALDPEESLRLILDRIRKASGDLAPVGERDLRAQLKVYKANFQMKYTPPQEVYRVPIALFQAVDSEPEEEIPSPEVAALRASKAWGWERFSSTAPRIFKVPGNHLTMLLEPHVRTLVDHLN
ncbi:MAG: alpha/beta fold hydrolase, partial [Bryobacteraceae bacterium]